MPHLLALAIAASGAAAGDSSRQARAPGEYLVTLSANAAASAIADVYGRFGIKDIKHLGSNVFLVTLAADPGPATMEKLRAESAQIRAVEPNLVYRSQGDKSSR